MIKMSDFLFHFIPSFQIIKVLMDYKSGKRNYIPDLKVKGW